MGLILQIFKFSIIVDEISVADPGSGSRDGGNPDPDPRSEIRNKYPGSATLVDTRLFATIQCIVL